MPKLKTYIQNFFKGHERSVKAKKNIVASLLIKGVSIVVGFLMVRVTLDYLDQTTYGVWLTMTSFISWFTFFEIGLGNGLRNKLAEALAIKDYQLARIYVSTTYAILSVVIGIIALIFFIANSFLDWTKILNTNSENVSELSSLALIVFGFFFLRFVLKLIGTVLYADQRPAIANLFGPIGSVISLIIVYVLTLTTNSSLLYLGWTLSVAPVVVLLLASIYFYGKEYAIIAPSISYIQLKYAKNLLSLGSKFFLIQIAGLIIFQSSNIIIAQLLGPDEVTIYNIAYKYFSIIIMLFSIITMPFWSAYTEAWAKKDIDWIKKTVKKLLFIWMSISALGFVMLLISPFAYRIWLGGKIEVPYSLSFLLLINFIVNTFGGVFNMFINGIGKIRVQMISKIIGVFIFVGLAICLIKFFHMRVEGLVIASIIANFYAFTIAPLQYKMIITGTAKGIWNR